MSRPFTINKSQLNAICFSLTLNCLSSTVLFSCGKYHYDFDILINCYLNKK